MQERDNYIFMDTSSLKETVSGRDFSCAENHFI